MPARTRTAPNILETALLALDLGIPPIAIEFGKKPASKVYGTGDIKRLDRNPPTVDDINRLFVRDRYGLAIRLSAVSGVAMFEFEGRALEDGILRAFEREVDEAGLGDEWRRLLDGGSFESPKGGLNVLLRPERPVPSMKLALRPDRHGSLETYAEYKGDSSYVVIPPTGGEFHEVGRPWRWEKGGLEHIARVDTDVLDELFRLARVHDLSREHGERTAYDDGHRGDPGLPGSQYNANPNAQDVVAKLLLNAGWEEVGNLPDGTAQLVRPGKDEGVSAHLFPNGVFFPFTTSSPFTSMKGHSPHMVKAVLEHAGDLSAAAKELAKDGWGDGAEQDRKGPVARDTLIALAHSDATFGRSTEGRPIAMPVTGPRIAMPLYGRDGYRQRLLRTYAMKRGKSPGEGALTEALQVLEAESYRNEGVTLSLRVGRDGDEFVVDIGDEQGAVVISAKGWEIVDRTGVTFRRPALQQPLPTPALAGRGDIHALREFLNVNNRDFRLLVGWLLATLVPDVPHPLVWLYGGHGSAKSVTARVVRSVTDPSATELANPPRKADEWAVLADNAWIISLDNLSSVREDLADTLCKMVTGIVDVTRSKYTNDEAFAIAIRRPIIVTSIDQSVVRPDLVSRLLPIEALPITDMRTEREFFETLEHQRRMILGGLFDLAVEVFAEMVDIQDMPDLPRMADFGALLAALDRVTGWTTLADYKDAVGAATADIVANDQVAAAIRDLLQEAGEWEGTPTQLIAQLGSRGVTGLPKTGQAMGNHLRRIEPALRQASISYERLPGRSHAGNRLRLSLPS